MVAEAVKVLVDQEEYEGIAKVLLGKLTPLVSAEEAKSKAWPKSPLALANALRRLAPNLRRIGIDIRMGKKSNGRNSKRIIRINRQPSVACVAGDAGRDSPGENGGAPSSGSDATRNGATQGDVSDAANGAKNSSKNNCSEGGGDWRRSKASLF